MKSARFNAGHFFSKAIGLPLLPLLLFGCQGSPPAPGRGGMDLGTGETAVLIHFQGAGGTGNMPEAVHGFSSTASGRFHPPIEQPGDPLLSLAEAADESGLLMLLVLNDGEVFKGTRDHLIIWTDSAGMPVRVEPETGPEMFTDSLWADPRTRQGTILRLIGLFKPDLVLEQISDNDHIIETIEFWNEAGEGNDITACFYSMPDPSVNHRGWGVLAGRGVTNHRIRGMFPGDFQATLFLLAGLDWHGVGYPAMQAFTLSENQ